MCVRGSVKHDPYDRQPTKEEFARTWQATDPRDLAKEIATHGGECPEEWPERRTNLVDLPIDSAPQDVEELMVTTRWNPTLVWEMTTKTREVFLEVYLDDLHDCYSEVIESLQPPNRVTFDTLRKFKHLAVSLSFLAIPDVCQAAFDAAEEEGGMDEFPEADVSPNRINERPAGARDSRARARARRAAPAHTQVSGRGDDHGDVERARDQGRERVAEGPLFEVWTPCSARDQVRA